MAFTRFFAVVTLLAVASTGCESKKSADATPQSAPASATAAPQAKAASAPTNSFTAPTAFDMKPIAVGQWVRMSVNTPGRPPGQTIVRIIGKEGDLFWYEIENNSIQGTTLIQFLMPDATKGGFSKNGIQKLRMKTPAGVQEFSGATLAAVNAVTDQFVSLIGKPNLDKAERSDATVKAGEFKGCYVHEFAQNLMGLDIKTKSWNHPAVPINGFVRSEGTAEGRTTITELLEMQMEGAKSSF